MDLPGNAGSKQRGWNKKTHQQNPHLFDDTSQSQQGYGFEAHDVCGGPHATFSGQQIIHDPMANMAIQYGQSLAGQGKDYVSRSVEKYVHTAKLKYYFAVDTTYVGKKLGLLVFPYVHTDWSMKYNSDVPVAPRYEVNAPDLYIPAMAFVTYILLAGVALGTQSRFTPESLGMICSTALVWMFIEILVLLLTMYMLSASADVSYLDLLAYCGYKYVGVIACLLMGLLFGSTGYYITLLSMSISTGFFLVRTMKLACIPQTAPDDISRSGKRRLYMLLVIAGTQPLFMWWLTSHLIP